VCRGYSSSSAQACEDAYHGTRDELDTIDFVTQVVASQTLAGTELATKAYQLESDDYELESAVLRALETPDAAQRWVTGERIFAGCDQIRMPADAVRRFQERNPDFGWINVDFDRFLPE
jgi:hypothetical protein